MNLHLRKRAPDRHGGVYIAVLGTALIVSMLGLTAILLGRVQNRMLTESADIRQAQLNAASAVELALLAISRDENWRANCSNGRWFTRRGTGAGSASVDVEDPLDSNLANDPEHAIRLRAFGHHSSLPAGVPHAEADQRIELLLDPIRDPLDCLRVGQETEELPDWGAVFSYYQTHGTPLTFNSLADRTPNFSRNPSLTWGITRWDGIIDDLDLSDFRDADDVEVVNDKGHSACLRVERNDWRECGANRLDASLLKPDTRYEVRLQIHPDFYQSYKSTNFRITFVAEYPDGTTEFSPDNIVRELGGNSWTPISGSLRTPNWPQQPTDVYLVINSNDPDGHHDTFYVDNLDVYETSAWFIYQKVLSHEVNQLYGGAPTSDQDPTKLQGVYWIDCGGTEKLIIERSRIMGTLLVLNPGPGSKIAYGPYDWSPSIPGYPTLLVHGDFTIEGTLASERRLREQENDVNYNPLGAPHPIYATDDWANGVDGSEVNDYDSQIRGLVAVSGNLTYGYNPPIRGQVIVGGTRTGSADFVYQPESLISPPPEFYKYRYQLRPGSTQRVVEESTGS